MAVDVLAVYRLTKLALDDEIAAGPREALYARLPEETKVGYLVRCPWCLSMWVGLGVAVARRSFPRAWAIVAEGLAASAVTGRLFESE